jgi:two-component system, cell cycle sensor histidine kinase and response regulator CckA
MGEFSEDTPEAKASLSFPSLLVLVEKIPAVLWTTNPDLRLTSLAGAGLAAMNIRPEDYVGMCLNDFSPCHEPDAPPIVAHRQALLGEAFTFDIEILGREFQAHVEPLRGPQGDIVGVIGVARDDTERRVAERALRLSEESYRSLIEEAPYGICRTTVSGQFLQVNRAMAEMLGYESAQELLLRSIRTDIFAEPGQYDRFHAQLRDRNSCQGFECEWRPERGKTILVSLGGRAVRDVAGEISYLEIVAENVTERKQLEDQLRQAQKMQAIGQLAGGVAHDFNNLLTVIKGQVEMVMGEMVPGDPLRSRLKEVELAADRAATLTGQLLAFSRRQVLQSKVLDLNAIISGMTRLLARLIGENIQLTFAPGADLGAVNADPGQIEQVLMNLVVNARDAMPDGGRLQIETHNADLDVNHAGQHAVVEPGQYVALVVSDTGHGMDAETSARIFEPFFTTKEPGRGTGLGLSMVYGVVKQSGGYIWVYSEPGKGAAFKIYLPRVAGTVEVNAISQELPSPSGRETILFAEDEGSVRQLVSAFLESRGYRVLVATDGASARQAAQSHKDKIDLLLTDVVMPKIGGHELAEDLRRTIPSLKVLFLSGYSGGPALYPSVQESGTAYVQKPFSMRFLARKIREVLDGPSASLVHPKADAATM